MLILVNKTPECLRIFLLHSSINGNYDTCVKHGCKNWIVSNKLKIINHESIAERNKSVLHKERLRLNKIEKKIITNLLHRSQTVFIKSQGYLVFFSIFIENNFVVQFRSCLCMSCIMSICSL